MTMLAMTGVETQGGENEWRFGGEEDGGVRPDRRGWPRVLVEWAALERSVPLVHKSHDPMTGQVFELSPRT